MPPPQLLGRLGCDDGNINGAVAETEQPSCGRMEGNGETMKDENVPDHSDGIVMSNHALRLDTVFDPF